MITSHCSTNIEIPKNVNDLQKQNDYPESLSTLRYAERAKQNEDPNSKIIRNF